MLILWQLLGLKIFFCFLGLFGLTILYVKNTLHKLLLLTGCYILTGLFLILFTSYNFLGWILILMYSGAILIIFLFIIKYFNLKKEIYIFHYLKQLLIYNYIYYYLKKNTNKSPTLFLLKKILIKLYNYIKKISKNKLYIFNFNIINIFFLYLGFTWINNLLIQNFYYYNIQKIIELKKTWLLTFWNLDILEMYYFFYNYTSIQKVAFYIYNIVPFCLIIIGFILFIAFIGIYYIVDLKKKN